MSRIGIIGGGAAGMAAAVFAARAGAQVTLLERNEKLGKKIYITGKGRCNLTNTAQGQEFLGNVPRNPRFLFSALNFFDNTALIELIEGQGVPTKVERGGRVFPESDHASDVTRAFERELRALGVEIRLNARVKSLERAQDAGAWRVTLEDGRRYDFDAAVVCAGGASYPSTGSDGFGARLLERAGLRVTPLRPALVPIETAETWPAQLTGISLKNVALRLGRGKKTPFCEQGEMLFTHFGISGPLALSLSSYLDAEPAGQELLLDLKPALSEDVLIARLEREITAAGRRQLRTMLEALMPRAMAPVLAGLSGLRPETPVYQLNNKQLRALAAFLKAVPLTVKGTRGFAEAIITRGGLDVKELNPSTLMVKSRPGLFAAGETLDVDALTGGFNLQIAFSTGALAGHSAATWCAQEA